MKLSRYIIELFLESSQGSELVRGFEALVRGEPSAASTRAQQAVEDAWSPMMFAVRRVLRARKVRRPTTMEEARAIYMDLFERGVGLDPSGYHADSSPDGLTSDAAYAVGAGSDEEARRWASEIFGISWALHELSPTHFVPYVFASRFDRFEAICAELDIPLTRLPGKASYRERALYYLAINDSLVEFRQTRGLSPGAMNAFLYGFATQHVPVDELSELPAPERAWFLMADPELDVEGLDKADADTRDQWQGQYDMRPGDIAVMWRRTPFSDVHSIWRAVSRGFADPFAYYYRLVWIGHPQKVPSVTFRELQADPVWREKPAMRAHFQGASGREVTKAEYEALLEILRRKGADVSTLPRLPPRDAEMPTGILNERDVEEKLLEPLLRKLGFAEGSWTRQLSLRMGRGERVYPDYAFDVSGQRGEEAARMVAEAKFSIPNGRQLEEAYLQARSYAERLQAERMILCAVEGLWVFERVKGVFSRERFTLRTWRELAEPAERAKLESAIGPSRAPSKRSKKGREVSGPR